VNILAQVFIAKIFVTVALWCLPLIFLPLSMLQSFGLPTGSDGMFLRMLGWAYLSLCVGYAYGLREALHGRVAMGPVITGIVSNGGACILLVWFGMTGAWDAWHSWVQIIGWASAIGTAAVTLQLIFFGLLADRRRASTTV